MCKELPVMSRGGHEKNNRKKWRPRRRRGRRGSLTKKNQKGGTVHTFSKVDSVFIGFDGRFVGFDGSVRFVGFVGFDGLNPAICTH
jgi:hypothetical protein